MSSIVFDSQVIHVIITEYQMFFSPQRQAARFVEILRKRKPCLCPYQEIANVVFPR